MGEAEKGEGTEEEAAAAAVVAVGLATSSVEECMSAVVTRPSSSNK